MLYPLVGIWKESKRHDNVENVPRSQRAEVYDVEVQFRYRVISDKREEQSIRGITKKVYVKVIETQPGLDTGLLFKEQDIIYLSNETEPYRIMSVDMHVPKDKESVVRMWPKRIQKYQVKTLTLG